MDAMTGNNYGGGGFMDESNNSASKTIDKKVTRFFFTVSFQVSIESLGNL